MESVEPPRGSTDYFENVITKFMISNRTDSLKTDINFLSLMQYFFLFLIGGGL